MANNQILCIWAPTGRPRATFLPSPGRQSLAEHLLATSNSDIGKKVEILQRWWRRKAAKLGESRVAHMGGAANFLKGSVWRLSSRNLGVFEQPSAPRLFPN